MSEKMKVIRTLYAHEIEVKVGNGIKQNGASFLLYKDARCDMAILDEVFGVNGWQREHVTIGGNLFCTISLWDDNRGWIKKQDVGVPSAYDSVKGESSDSFKRSGFNVGIGRELYTGPFIWIKLSDDETYNKNGKWQLKASVNFSVSEIEYNENRVISKLVITDSNGKVRYTFGSKKKVSEPKKQSKTPTQPTKQQSLEKPENLVELMMEAVPCDKTKAEKILLKTYLDQSGKEAKKVDDITQEYKDKFYKMAKDIIAKKN